jgi:hypothetical protein
VIVVGLKHDIQRKRWCIMWTEILPTVTQKISKQCAVTAKSIYRNLILYGVPVICNQMPDQFNGVAFQIWQRSIVVNHIIGHPGL